MQQLSLPQYVIAQPLFATLATFNFSVAAVLAGTAPGTVWVNAIDGPRVAFMAGPEGHYLAGDWADPCLYPALRAAIPPNAYLIVDSDNWATVLAQIWVNFLARPHLRQHLRFAQPRRSDWRACVPADFQLLSVDAALFGRTELQNHSWLTDWVANWHAMDYFLQQGIGYCLLHDNTIVALCMADCVVGKCCEIGIFTDPAYRRRGLATLVVAATVEGCLARGLTDIGWHCLSSNAGSWAVATAVGFVPTRAYVAYSSTLPAENASDLPPAVYADWALHYEQASQTQIGYAVAAAEAWALAGEHARALANLQRLTVDDWAERAWRLEDWNWRLSALREEPAFKALVTRLRHLHDKNFGN